MSQLLDWVEEHKYELSWFHLSKNTAPEAIDMLEAYPEKINWSILSENKSAIHLIVAELETNPNTNKIDWDWLSVNPAIFKQSNEYVLK